MNQRSGLAGGLPSQLLYGRALTPPIEPGWRLVSSRTDHKTGEPYLHEEPIICFAVTSTFRGNDDPAPIHSVKAITANIYLNLLEHVVLKRPDGSYLTSTGIDVPKGEELEARIHDFYEQQNQPAEVMRVDAETAALEEAQEKMRQQQLQRGREQQAMQQQPFDVPRLEH